MNLELGEDLVKNDNLAHLYINVSKVYTYMPL